MLRLATAIAVFAAIAIAPAAAAQRPGTVDAGIGRFAASRIEGLDVAKDGRIVVAGRTNGYPLLHPWVRAYLPSGAPDPEFGQDGVAVLEDDRRQIAGALFQDDGRVLVARSSDPFSYYFDGPVPHLVTRLTREGHPDPTFGSGGSIQPDLGAGPSSMIDIALQDDGRVIVMGTREADSNAPTVIVVARFLPDGSPDTGFGSNGVIEVPTATPGSRAAMALQPDGRVLLSVRRAYMPAIARLSTDGLLDESFGSGGLAQVQLRRKEWARQVHEAFEAPALAVAPNGDIRVGLEFRAPRGDGYRMGLIGLTEDGHPDRGFARDGRALGPLPRRGGESAATAVTDHRGSILVAGDAWSGEEFAFTDHALIRRFREDGSPDESFGTDGAVRDRLTPTGYNVFEQRLAFQDRDTLLVAAHVYDGKYSFWGEAALDRLNAGYDDAGPRISVGRRGCRAIRVRITDASALDRVVVRADGHVIRRTARKRFRVRLRRGTRVVSVRATDLAGNLGARGVRLPRC